MKRLLALLCVVSASVGLVAVPAGAEQVSRRDPRADVGEFRNRGPVLGLDRPDVDLVRYAIGYDDHRISVVLRYRDLRPRGTLMVSVVLAPGGGRDTEAAGVELTAERGDRAGTAALVGREPCAVEHDIDYDRDVVRLEVPAACLGRPRYVDTAVGTTLHTSRGRFFADLAPATVADLFDDEPLPTVRVRRG